MILTQKFTQTYPATTIYYHICKFTGKLFASPIRRCTYSTEGQRLKKEQDQLLKEAAKHVCKVFFYVCKETGKHFTTRTPYQQLSDEGRQITQERTRLRNMEGNRQRRKSAQAKERERIRSANRKEYLREYHKAWHQRKVNRSAEIDV